MMKKLFALFMSVSMSAMLLSGCGRTETAEDHAGREEMTDASQSSGEETPKEETTTESTTEASAEKDTEPEEKTVVRIASLKGPTSMGLVKLWQDADDDITSVKYEYSMHTAADEILPELVKGNIDIALLPANAAANLYQKSEGKIVVIDINTLGVLYMVSGDTSITAMEDLKGKTVYLTGKGTTPDYALLHLMESCGLTESDVTLEYKSEATEVAAVLSEHPEAVGLLPQPFVTAACIQNDALQIVLDVNAEWEKTSGGKGLITGVTVVNRGFLESNPQAVAAFLEDHKKSADFANTEVEEAAALVVKAGIVEKEPIAQKAIPKCNITCIFGSQMKEMLSEYLDILYEQNPEFIGGAVPDDGFYYEGQN